MSVIGNAITLGGGSSKKIDITVTKALPTLGDIQWPTGCEIVANCPNTTNGNINGIFYTGGGPKKITVFSGSGYRNLSNAFRGQTDLEVIDLPSAFLDDVSIYATFYNCQNLRIISGNPLRPNGTNSVYTQNAFAHCYSLEEVRFVENCIKVSTGFPNSSYLTDASLVSIANALFEGSTSQAVSFHATQKARIQNILGVSELDETETYHVFTPNASGTLSLREFITNVKGWTVG